MINPIKIWFTDFWIDYNYSETYFTSILKREFNIIIDPNPDFLIHSVFDKNFLKYNCTRICYTAENTRPNYLESDYHIGFDYCNNPNYLRWPNFLRYHNLELLITPKNISQILSEKKEFCAFVVSNDSAKERIDLFHELSRYKKVISGGKTLNNTGYLIKNKIEFLKAAKFTIAYENSLNPGYTTEKIYEAFVANSVPIYWGNPRITEDFNPKSFINAFDFKSKQKLIEYVKYVNENDHVYQKYIEEPCFIDNKIPVKFQQQTLIEFYKKIFNNENYENVASKNDRLKYYNYTIRKKAYKLKKHLQKKNQ